MASYADVGVIGSDELFANIHTFLRKFPGRFRYHGLVSSIFFTKGRPKCSSYVICIPYGWCVHMLISTVCSMMFLCLNGFGSGLV